MAAPGDEYLSGPAIRTSRMIRHSQKNGVSCSLSALYVNREAWISSIGAPRPRGYSGYSTGLPNRLTVPAWQLRVFRDNPVEPVSVEWLSTESYGSFVCKDPMWAYSTWKHPWRGMHTGECMPEENPLHIWPACRNEVLDECGKKAGVCPPIGGRYLNQRGVLFILGRRIVSSLVLQQEYDVYHADEEPCRHSKGWEFRCRHCGRGRWDVIFRTIERGGAGNRISFARTGQNCHYRQDSQHQGN